ncbi:hypothetical protein HPB48_024444 [Haemaphysalis longicornis]|uniref:Uncharacterized protein n=1 Tax=Haemaphysalis longicornis TaxID=44386 RepID=A0A9J6H7U8_HAELO|nr:hypothetical protein HPB48_024444 [Haemaphysalis longicornis]
MVGWTEDLRQEFSGLLAIHMSDVDALLIKHLASSRFLRECRSRDLMNLFAKRWMEKFSDVVATVSVFNAVVQLYNKTVMIPRQAREFLQKHLVEELRLGQLALNPERAMTCSSFLLRFGNTRSKEFALEIVERMKPQLSPLDFAQFLQSQRFDDEFSREHNLPHAWYNCIVEKRQEISGLHTAAYLLSKFFPPGTSIAPANAQLWADVFEESAPVLSPATFWHVLRCISGHRLYVPATLEVLCESALRQRLKVQLAMKLVEACVQWRRAIPRTEKRLKENHRYVRAKNPMLLSVKNLTFGNVGGNHNAECFALHSTLQACVALRRIKPKARTRTLADIGSNLRNI